MAMYDSKYVIDLMWDRWNEGLSQMYTSQKQMENLFLLALNEQKKVWEFLAEQVDFYSSKLKEEIENYQSKTNEVVENFQDEATKDANQKIQNQLEDILARISKITFTPQNAINQGIAKSFAQIEESIEEFLTIQDKNRTEMKTMIDDFANEMKNVFEKINEAFEKYQNYSLTK